MNMIPFIQHAGSKETSEHYIAALKSEKEELEAEIAKEKLQSLQLKQELVEAETRNTDITKASISVFLLMAEFVYSLLLCFI